MRPLWRTGAVLIFFAATLTAGLEEDLAVGFDHFYNLEYDQSIAAFEHSAATWPKSPLPQDGLAQAILYREMLRNGALDSELIDGTNSFLRRPKLEASQDTTNRFFNAINKALELAQQQLDANPRDKTALHARAVAYAFRSNWNFLVRKSWHDSLSDATSARKAEDQILAIDPNDPDARLGQGVHEYIIGGLPWTWRTLGFLVGFHGDKVHGLATVENVAKYGVRNKADAEIMLCAFYRRERESKKALPLLADVIRQFPRNYLLRFEQAKMYADIGDGKNALHLIDEIQRMKETKVPGLVNTPWVKIWFERATIQFWYRQLDQSMANFQKVVAKPDEIDLYTGASSYMRMGQILDMQNHHAQAIADYRKSMDFSPQSDEAKESHRYISTPFQRKP
ncbi:MAG TPA: tetratricopeptide repeat protein [Bryobacteraceae bacterium]